MKGSTLEVCLTYTHTNMQRVKGYGSVQWQHAEETSYAAKGERKTGNSSSSQCHGVETRRTVQKQGMTFDIQC